jgi:hypothetical protein
MGAHRDLDLPGGGCSAGLGASMDRTV